ncbi:MAG: cytochrome c oxidase subunit II [Rhodospirillaceae bacterium]|nr:cytochrome c oxidase subunit II [Rhodospirillaceae bacterium]
MAAVLVPASGRAAPMGYMRGYGAKAYPVTSLSWGLLVLSLVVVAVVTVLLVWALLRRRAPAAPTVVMAPGGGLSWITVGVGVSFLALVASAAWTVAVLARIGEPPAGADLTVEVTGHQWWWQVRYLDADPSLTFTTANEIHIPTGRPVRFRLIGADVIHSFWVPPLGGKTDLVPGQTNETWLQADRPGTYRGQCAEYCGLQHAHMALAVVAEPPDAFAAWRRHQAEGAGPPDGDLAARGQAAFVLRCGACHAVRGTAAGGILGPDLSHFMTRQTIAAGTLPNTPGHLSAWIADPQRIKPGNLMPRLALPGPTLAAIRAFLETLD